MEEMDLDEPILYRVQCIKCKTYLSNPFKMNNDYKSSQKEIRVERYKGDNINYHSNNDYNQGGKILYSFIYCLKCSEKVGYWMSQASIKEKNNINHIFFFRKCILLLKYDKNSVSEEEDRKFEQEEIFYNSKYLKKDIIDYAKEHINNFIENVEKLEKQRTEARFCYERYEKKILKLKEFFSDQLKYKGKTTLKLGIDFTKDEIIKAEKRNKLRLKKIDKYEEKDEEDDDDDKSNGININNGENGNRINGIDNINNNNDNELNKNGGNIVEMNNNINDNESEITIGENYKKKNNKEPSKIQKEKRKYKKRNK